MTDIPEHIQKWKTIYWMDINKFRKYYVKYLLSL